MPRNLETTRSLHITMPADAYEILRQQADEERRPIADVVRQAIENYLRTQGYTIQIDVKRGQKPRTTD